MYAFTHTRIYSHTDILSLLTLSLPWMHARSILLVPLSLLQSCANASPRLSLSAGNLLAEPASRVYVCAPRIYIHTATRIHSYTRGGGCGVRPPSFAGSPRSWLCVLLVSLSRQACAHARESERDGARERERESEREVSVSAARRRRPSEAASVSDEPRSRQDRAPRRRYCAFLSPFSFPSSLSLSLRGVFSELLPLLLPSAVRDCSGERNTREKETEHSPRVFVYNKNYSFGALARTVIIQ